MTTAFDMVSSVVGDWLRGLGCERVLEEDLDAIWYDSWDLEMLVSVNGLHVWRGEDFLTTILYSNPDFYANVVELLR